jgi:hypothetical protein
LNPSFQVIKPHLIFKQQTAHDSNVSVNQKQQAAHGSNVPVSQRVALF